MSRSAPSSTTGSGTLSRLESVEVATLDAAGCATVLGDVRRVRGWLDAFEAQITSRATELHRTAGAAPAADVHTRCGGVSAAEGRRKQRRSETIDEVPGFGEALGAGRIGAEHVDALANATTKLGDDVKDSLLGAADSLLSAATTLTPEQFGRHVRDEIRRLERDNGLERDDRQRRDTFLSRSTNVSTGMVEGRFSFHPELASQIFGAVDREVAAMTAESGTAAIDGRIERMTDRRLLAAEALGRLVAGGHQQRRPLEADISVIIDAVTLADGAFHEHSV
ncbi:MAG: hypothetical protein RLZZ01_1330 [Actinomycetota bacterium]